MKKYNEPEFKVVNTKTQDVITTSGESSGLPSGNSGWEAGRGNGGVPITEL
ncbi:MAG: hypothetical protein IJ731_08430 [Eubacterium sp.]|nr:hypothetical protein [Eubacterium sp.]